MSKKSIKFFPALCFIFLALPALAAFPKPAGFVNDFAGVISPDTKSSLELLLSSFEKKTGIEVAVATLPTLDGSTVEDTAVRLYKEWGIGKKGKDNGVLFLIAPAERKLRIEAGYGLEGAINDALAGRIMDDHVLPYFKSGNLDSGIAAGTVAIVKTIVEKEGLDFNFERDTAGIVQYDNAPPEEKKSLFRKIAEVVFVIILIIFFIRHPWLFLLLMSGGRGGGGRGFGGGFGGFGGGMSGGGGVSRGW